MAIDLKKAREVFETYLDEYDRNDEKIKLKIVHTYGVVSCARKIGKKMKLGEEQQQLAELIALLHDIGRFEQLRLDVYKRQIFISVTFEKIFLFLMEKAVGEKK